MLYLMFVRPAGWMVLLARPAASKDAELLTLRQEVDRPAQTKRPPAMYSTCFSTVRDGRAVAPRRCRSKP
jgi:hypothetical protein